MDKWLTLSDARCSLIFRKHNSGSPSISHHSKNQWLRVVSKLFQWENLAWTDQRLSLTIIIRFAAEILMFDYHGPSQQSRDFRKNSVYVHHLLFYIQMFLNSQKLLTPRVSWKEFSPHKLDICFIESLCLEWPLPPFVLKTSKIFQMSSWMND